MTSDTTVEIFSTASLVLTSQSGINILMLFSGLWELFLTDDYSGWAQLLSGTESVPCLEVARCWEYKKLTLSVYKNSEMTNEAMKQGNTIGKP